MKTQATTAREYRLRWWTLLVISISITVVILDSTIVNIALPTLQRELNTTLSELQWIVNSYIMVCAALMLTMGALGDRLGRARILQVGIIVFAVGSLAASLANSGGQLILWRAIMGIGAAMILPSTLAIVTNVFPREERGKAIGVWAGLNGIGIALGPIIGGSIVESLPWNWIFLINIPIAIVALAAGWFLIPNSRDPNPKRLDFPGTILSAAALTSLIFGLIQGGNWGWAHYAVVGSLAISVVLIALFVIWERHTSHPMLEIGFFHSARFSVGIGAISLMSLALIGINLPITLYMQFVNGYTPFETGVRFIPLALGIFIGSGSADKMVRLIGTTWVMTIGFVITAICAALMSLWQVDMAYWQLGLMFFCLGFSLGYIAAPATVAIMGAMSEARVGIGSAMNTVSRMVAGAIGVAVLSSALNTIYSSSFYKAASAIAGLQAEVVEAASESLGSAVIIAETLPPAIGDVVAQAAKESFMDGWQVMAFITCGISVIGAIVVLKFMPSRHKPLNQSPAEE
ncbi:DHA2 family efflux MFS transporter permease subunit [Chloroflexota bacterium]